MRERETSSPSRATRINRRTIHLAFWTGAWVATMALATFGPSALWHSNQAVTVAAIALNVLIGIGMIAENVRHLATLDELMQRIQLEAMGLSLGIGAVGGLSYTLLDTTDVIASDAEIGHVVMLMAVVYLAALGAGLWRYR